LLAAAALALVPSAVSAQQQGAPVWAGASGLHCQVETAATCNAERCAPLQALPTILFDLAAKRACASSAGEGCTTGFQEITLGEYLDRLLLVVSGTGTSFSVASDGAMSGANVQAPNVLTFYGRCRRQ
jgi:hypothetical protein